MSWIFYVSQKALRCFLFKNFYMNYFKSNWYLLYTRPHHEKKITIYLQERQVEHYLPMVKTIKQKQGQSKENLSPLFPSYVFVYLENVRDYYTASGAPGGLHFVKMEGQLAVVDAKIIQNLKLVIERNMNLEVVPEFSAGQEIVVKTGPFAGLSGEIIRHLGRQKVQIRMHIMQCSLLVSIASEYLSAL